MLEIQPQHVSLSKLLSGRLFRVPQYQRAYSWRSKERKDLFGDILRTWMAGNDASHFMSMIVGLRRGKTKILADEYEIIEIVDGQQRITTLILLLKAIAKAADRADPVEEKIARELDDTLVKADAASLLLLQTNHDTSGYFADYLRDGICPPPISATTIADRNRFRRRPSGYAQAASRPLDRANAGPVPGPRPPRGERERWEGVADRRCAPGTERTIPNDPRE